MFMLQNRSQVTYLRLPALLKTNTCWQNKDTTHIILTLIDDDSDSVMASLEMLPEELPDSFEINSLLQVAAEERSVIHAEPVTKAEFTKSGKLTLRICKVQTMATEAMCFSQLDITEGFDENQGLGADDWIKTRPLNATLNNTEASGQPPRDADSDKVYRVAATLSVVRESIPIEGDGVYCPICHIANIDIGKLHTPCPNCCRGLLKFGWA